MLDMLNYGGKMILNRFCSFIERVLYFFLKSSEVGFNYSFLFIKCFYFLQGVLLKFYILLLVIVFLELFSGLEDQV